MNHCPTCHRPIWKPFTKDMPVNELPQFNVYYEVTHKDAVLFAYYNGNGWHYPYKDELLQDVTAFREIEPHKPYKAI